MAVNTFLPEVILSTKNFSPYFYIVAQLTFASYYHSGSHETGTILGEFLESIRS